MEIIDTGTNEGTETICIVLKKTANLYRNSVHIHMSKREREHRALRDNKLKRLFFLFFLSQNVTLFSPLYAKSY